MKLKTIVIEGKTYAVVDDKGLPVYVQDGGNETGFDAPQAVAKIGALNREAQSHREAKEAAEGKLKGFEGIDDPAAAIRALGVVKNLDEKKLLDAGKVEEIKAAAVAAVEERYKPIVAERDTLAGQLNTEIVGGAFARSKFVSDKVAVPVPMLQATFAKNFKVENGKLVPYGADGKQLYSRKVERAGEIAEFDEAIELMISADPYKESILKSTAGGGGGSPVSGVKPGSKQIKRADFDALSNTDRVAKMKEGIAVVD